ncbi:AAA domain-containing protein, partial [Actinomyces naeslundii]|uniref:AAA domain-containing protein n=1 Tax=Actinomyces naeslundii TaxID=1655 RepID=UPI00097A9FD4
RHYYGGRLLTFPSPLTIVPGSDAAPGGHGISLRRVRGRYFRPEDRARHPHVQPNTNPLEAKRVVDEVLRHVEACPDRLPSLGVITFNDRQRDLIENSLREIASPRVIEALDARDGLFVRNLENVQGEERDTILFSATFAANAQGDLPLNFGVLNHAGGERRLNVAITRARKQIIVFTSFDPQDLHAERTAYRGVKDLRAYLHQAAEGRAPRALPASQSPLSWHRREIAEALEAAGLTVRTGVGHSTFEIDLVLAVADQPGRPAVAVMLDGPQWNKREGVVDRDLLPVDVLRTMGWQRVERVWMPEWVADPKAVVARLVKAASGHWAQQTPSTTVLESGWTGRAEDAASLTDDDSKPGAWGAADLGEEALVPASGPRAPGEEYTAWSPAGVRPLEILDRAGTDPEAKKVLVEVATTICQVEAPIARHRLYVKISRAFGLSRTVKSREESIRTALGEAFAYFDEDGFVWTSREAALAAPTYRRNALDHVDSIQEIHPRELVGLMAQARARNPEWASREDLFTWALKRLSAKNRSLGARGVSEALTRALKEAEREQP